MSNAISTNVLADDEMLRDSNAEFGYGEPTFLSCARILRVYKKHGLGDLSTTFLDI